jgi:S1-C subfamily serine protease
MNRKKAILILSALLGFIILVGGGVGAGIYFQKQQTTNPLSSIDATTDGNSNVTSQESTIATIAEKVGPSVVSITTKSQASTFSGSSSLQGAGTGMIVSTDGYVMTNNHVIDNARDVVVVDSNGEEYDDVTIIGRDPLNDVAFLKINADGTEFKPVTLGNSSTLRIGQQVVAIGNALGQYSNTVTSGIVSGVGRPVTADAGNGETESLTDLIQTDASINPGNSGGPLLNAAGQVIGINTAIAEDANGIGFSIPINSTKGILAGVLETGKVSRAFLGVSYLDITSDVAREYDLTVKAGAFVNKTGGSAVSAGSPADKAGLKDDDVITKVNDDTIGKAGGLSSIIGQYKPGDKVTITYIRDGKEQTASLTFTAYAS